MREINCLIIAGEKSGEEHALSFIGKIKEKIPSIHFWGIGGEQLAKEGVELIYNLNDFSSWGISTVISKIPFYISAENKLFKSAVARNCKVAILIDFQTFNLRLARRLKAIGVDVLYYVAPQAWAWKSCRVKILQKTVHTLFTVLPFEKKWFQERGVDKVRAVQHSLVSSYKNEIKSRRLGYQYKPHDLFNKRVRLLLLPGSRNFEVQSLLKTFMQTVSYLRPFSFELGLVPSSNVHKSLYGPYWKFMSSVFPDNRLSDALEWADISLAASGTVSLTCALFQVPTVVAYRISLLDEFFFNTFISYRGYFSLANIVHQEEIFPECVQESCSSYNLANTVNKWLSDESAYKETKEKLALTLGLLEGEENIENYMAATILKAYGIDNSYSY